MNIKIYTEKEYKTGTEILVVKIKGSWMRTVMYEKGIKTDPYGYACSYIRQELKKEFPINKGK